MTAQSSNIFIVQTAGSHQSQRSKGNQISLINKQSALYKYRQQKKKRERRSPSTIDQLSIPRTFDTQRTSWLLESRLPQCAYPNGGNALDAGGPHLYADGRHEWLPVVPIQERLIEDCYQLEADENAYLHDCYAGLRTDPFSCMPVEDSSVVLYVSDTYVNMMIPHISQVAKIFNVDNVYLDIFWTMIFQEETIDAVVAMAYCADANWRKLIGSAPHKELFIHHGRSLANLHQRFADPDVTQTGTTICMLMYNCNVARFLGNMAAAKQHMSMIRRLLENELSLESLGYHGKLKHLLMQWEYFLTLSAGEEPLIQRRDQPMSIYPSMPLCGEFADLASALPKGLEQLAKTGRLSCQVLNVLGRAHEMVAAVAAGTTQAFFATPNENPYPDFCSAIPCLRGSEDNEGDLERLLCCAIFLLIPRLLSPVKWALWSLPATGARTILTQHVFSCRVTSEVEKKCLIWLWTITIDAWAIGGDEFLEKARQLMQRLHARFPDTLDWPYVADVAKEFFWTDDLRASCEEYWKTMR